MNEPDASSERTSCPWCAEEVSTAAKICRHCQRALLWTLCVETQVEARTAYRAARMLQTQTNTGFVKIKHNLESAPGVVLKGLVRGAADTSIAILKDLGIAARLELDEESDSEPVMRVSIVSRIRRRPGVVVGALAVVAISLIVITQRESPPRDPRAPISPGEIGARIERAAVHLQCSDQLGAGFFIEPDLVLTNAHVVCDGPEIKVVTVEGTTRTGRVVERDSRHDLALVRVSGADIEPLPLGDATALSRGDRVFAMGSPLGLDFTLSQGIVSHPDRVILGVSYVQIDASVHPGNSGGALVDSVGRAVAVVSMQVEGNADLGFAVPVNYLRESSTVLAARKPWFDLVAWNERTKVARQSELAEVEQVRTELDRPMLAESSFQPPGAVIAVVARAAETAPAPEGFSFILRRDEEILCRPTGRVTRWRQWNSEEGDAQSRWAQWLESHDLQAQFWIGPAHLGMGGCPGPEKLIGATLELEGGATSANRTQIRSSGWRPGGRK